MSRRDHRQTRKRHPDDVKRLENNTNKNKPELMEPPKLPFDIKEGEVTAEDVAERVALIPENELFIKPDEEANLGFKPNPHLNPNNPDDIHAINAEAAEFMDKFVKPKQEGEAEESLEKFKEVIKTEEEFLEHFKPKDLSLQLVHEGALVTFHIKPLEPGDDFSKLQTDSAIFTDMDTATRNAIMKQAKGISLTDREQKYIDEINSGTKSKMAESGLEMAHSILSQCVTPPAYDNIEDKEEQIKARLAFWKTQPYAFKIFLSNEVTRILGLDTATQFRIFRPSGDD